MFNFGNNDYPKVQKQIPWDTAANYALRPNNKRKDYALDLIGERQKESTSRCWDVSFQNDVDFSHSFSNNVIHHFEFPQQLEWAAQSNVQAGARTSLSDIILRN